jgi:transposase-like protein
MPRPCTVCAHSDLDAIDAALVAGGSLRDIARRFGLSKDAVARHRDEHLPAALTEARDAEDAARADDLLAQVRQLQVRAHRILDRAEQTGDLRTALGAIREARGNLELLAKLLGELNDQPTVNVMVSPEWVSIRTVIIAALGPYPEARAAVADRLLALEGAR